MIQICFASARQIIISLTYPWSSTNVKSQFHSEPLILKTQYCLICGYVIETMLKQPIFVDFSGYTHHVVDFPSIWYTIEI